MRNVVKLNREAIDAARGRRLLTLTKLAERVGITLAWLSQIRRGQPAGFRTARRLAQVLGVPLNSLVVQDDSEEQAPALADARGRTNKWGHSFRTTVKNDARSTERER